MASLSLRIVGYEGDRVVVVVVFVFVLVDLVEEGKEDGRIECGDAKAGKAHCKLL